jgi:hypothetical protein
MQEVKAKQEPDYYQHQKYSKRDNVGYVHEHRLKLAYTPALQARNFPDFFYEPPYRLISYVIQNCPIKRVVDKKMIGLNGLKPFMNLQVFDIDHRRRGFVDF